MSGKARYCNVTIAQAKPDYLDLTRNLLRVEEMLDAAGGAGDGDLIVLPELFASGYAFRSAADLDAVAEPVPGGPTTDWLLALARRTGATVVAGLPELREDAEGRRIYNSAAVVAPPGLVGVYRKVHLFHEETRYFAPGNLGFPVFDVTTRSGAPYRLGVMVCFDWYFPESARTLALVGADVIAHPSNLVRPDCPRAMPIRALENRVFTATANRIGAESNGTDTLTFIGQSLVCDPAGQVLAAAPRDGEAVLTATLDLDEARTKWLTPYNDLFADRRPGTYGLGIDGFPEPHAGSAPR